MKLKSIVVVGFLAISAPLVTGCALSADSGEKQEHVGTVEMKLGATSASGIAYRLRSANFTITDASGVVVTTLHSEDADPDAPVLTADLSAGSFTITLEDGWYMQRATGEIVDSALISTASRNFTIFDDLTTPVQYSFKVEGEAITFNGTLNVSIRVGECRQDPFEPNDTQAEAASLALFPVNASVCGEDDWYTFPLNVFDGTQVAIAIDFVHANGDIDMRLIQPDGTQLISQGVTNQERIQVTAQPGDYFLRVYGFLGAVGDYTLSNAVVPPMM